MVLGVPQRRYRPIHAPVCGGATRLPRRRSVVALTLALPRRRRDETGDSARYATRSPPICCRGGADIRTVQTLLGQ